MTDNKIRIRSKRKVVKLSATFFIALALLGSCKKEKTTIGSNLLADSLNVHKAIDTFTIITYTDLLDSMESDETSVNLLGYYNDPVFGSVDCGIVTQIRLSGSNPDIGATAADVIVDSVVLQLGYTGIKWYGNLDDMTVEVYEVDEDLLRDDQDYYTFDTPITTGADLVMSGSNIVSPDVLSEVALANGDTLAAHLRIRLDTTTLGDKLVDLKHAGSMSTDEAFVSAFKGLYIKANGSSLVTAQGGVLYFGLESSLSKMTLYFHEVSDLTPKEYDFNINASAARYNKIDYDRSGTTVESVLMSPSLGQEAFYAQAGGAWAVVELPHIMDLNNDADGNPNPKIINKAQLILPVQDFAADGFDPSVSMFIARVVDSKLSDFTLDYSLSSALAGNTVNYDQTKKEFRFNMTLELQAILNGETENKGFRIYAPSFFASSIERVIFNGPDSPLKNKARLEVTFTDY